MLSTTRKTVMIGPGKLPKSPLTHMPLTISYHGNKIEHLMHYHGPYFISSGCLKYLSGGVDYQQLKVRSVIFNLYTWSIGPHEALVALLVFININNPGQ